MVHIHNRRRRGSLGPLAALLMIFLVGMVAFSVDMSWIVSTQTELQNVADAAALAGAHDLMDGYIQYNLYYANVGTRTTAKNLALSKARTRAKNFTSYNSAGAVSNLILADSDIEFGYLNGSNVYTADSAGATNFPNTIKVLIRRDGTSNTPLGLFFSPVLGTKNINLNATASATIYNGQFSSLTGPAVLLPITYDQNHWNSFVSTGQGPDGSTLVDANGVPELQVYPSPTNNPGNFGFISLNQKSFNASDIRSWIDNGMTQSDVNALTSASWPYLLPIESHIANNDHASWNWQAGPGFKASNVSDINSHTGSVTFLPLFKPYNSTPGKNTYTAAYGNGSNTYYNMVQFVSVKIVTGASENRYVQVQPAALIDPDVTFLSGTLQPAGSQGTFYTTFTTPKLTR